jgi:hypothetical protein
MREGVPHLPGIKVGDFFVTLHKTEAYFSPTTMYRDYAVNERLFHWRSQTTTSADSPTGRRYVEQEAQGYTVLLFAREHRSRHALSEPLIFIGPARYVGHTGSRPMSIRWGLTHPLRAWLYQALAVA